MLESARITYMCRRGVVGGVAVEQIGATEGNVFAAQLLVDECENARPQFVEKGGSRVNGACPEDCELYIFASSLPWYDGSKKTGDSHFSSIQGGATALT